MEGNERFAFIMATIMLAGELESWFSLSHLSHSLSHSLLIFPPSVRYNTYQSLTPAWPMNPKRLASKRHFNFLLDFDYDPARDEHMFILEHLFLNSDGFALTLDPTSPLYYRRDPAGALVGKGDPIFCFSVNNTYPYMENNRNPEYLDLKFKLFSGKNIKSIYEIVANKFGFIPRPVDLPDVRLFQDPIWSTWVHLNRNLTQANLLQYAKDIKRHHFHCSMIELHRNWEQHYGDLAFDPERFPDPNKMISDLRQLGLVRTSVWVYPDIHIDSPAYLSAERHFLKDHTGSNPVLINYSDGAGSYLDFSSSDTSRWFLERLRIFSELYRVDSFHFNEAVLYDYSPVLNALDSEIQRFPSLLTKAYADTVFKLGNGAVILDSGFKTQHVASFVSVNPKTSDWSMSSGLRSLVPSVLTLSLAGYSFTVPGIIGGGFSDSKPSEELYIRWVQAVTFMPVMQFSIPPWIFPDSSSVLNITQRYVKLHREHAQLLITLSRKRVREGTPIIRPMWYAEPENRVTFTIDDQFMVGDNLVVAPVLEQGKTERNVYLPSGNWVDQDGASYSGSQKISIQAPIEVLPYFRRKL